MFGGGTDATMLSNPISSEMSHMRPSLLPGLLQAAARNQARGIMDMALFEVGPIWHGGEPEDQEALACGILVGQTDPKDVHSSRRTVDVYDVKADVEAVLHALGAPTKVQFQRGLSNWWHPGRSARMALGKTSLAGFGEVHPTVLAALGVRGPVMAFAIHTKNIPMPKTKSATRPALSISDLQAVERDFAFVVDQSVEAITLVNAAKGADKVLIEEVQVFDEFIGGSLAEGLKSLAFTVRLQPKDTTLKDLEIEAVSAKIVEKVSKATGGKLRS
jgi:phenylalanyl-tRNA synthetase beta chain